MSKDVEGLELYRLLRNLTSPIVAITTIAEGRSNGMIANSAQRASLVPSLPRVSLYVSKTNFTHDLIYRGGLFGMHLLRADQWDVVRALGLRSGRDGDKLAELETVLGVTGCPLLAHAFATLECRVVNAMDAGAATFFLGDVVAARVESGGEVMTSDRFRADIPPDMGRQYEARLAAAQHDLARLAADVQRGAWPGPVAGPEA